jgi:hypothetical protein
MDTAGNRRPKAASASGRLEAPCHFFVVVLVWSAWGVGRTRKLPVSPKVGHWQGAPGPASESESPPRRDRDRGIGPGPGSGFGRRRSVPRLMRQPPSPGRCPGAGRVALGATRRSPRRREWGPLPPAFQCPAGPRPSGPGPAPLSNRRSSVK